MIGQKLAEILKKGEDLDMVEKMTKDVSEKYLKVQLKKSLKEKWQMLRKAERICKTKSKKNESTYLDANFLKKISN